MLRESIRANYIGKIIEDEEPVYPPKKSGTKRDYHAFTRGLILNEICRRVDPDGRTLGELLRYNLLNKIHLTTILIQS